MLIAAVPAALSLTLPGDDPLARPALGVLAAMLGALALAWRAYSLTVRRIGIEPRDWRIEGGAYEYVIKPWAAGGRSHVTVKMPLPGGGEEEVVADVLHEATGGIRVRAGSPVRVYVYVD